MARIRKGGRLLHTEELDVDPSPLYRVQQNPDGTFDHSGAFDPKYEYECEQCGERRLVTEVCECD